MERLAATVTILSLVLLLTACGDNRFDRGVTGGAVGAGTGAVAGVLLGPLGVATGALIGLGAGAATGVATDEDQIDLGEPIYR